MKKERKLRIFVDGGSRGNPGRGACAAVFLGPDGAVLREEGKYLGRCSNDLAGLNGLRLALAAAGRIGAEELEIFSGSLLLVKQYNGECALKDAALAPLLADIKRAAAGFKKVSLGYVPRGKSREADRLVARILDDARDAGPALDRALARENEGDRLKI